MMGIFDLQERSFSTVDDNNAQFTLFQYDMQSAVQLVLESSLFHVVDQMLCLVSCLCCLVHVCELPPFVSSIIVIEG